MTLIAHLSDLHFGRNDPRVVGGLLTALERHRPDLVVVSGDLTQRARAAQFAQARDFLARLPAPVLVVPGNHDLHPLYRPLGRLIGPRDKFRRHLPGHEPLPVWRSPDLVAVGLDSTRPLRWKSGVLTDAHLDQLDRVLAAAPPDAGRMVFLHHPPASARAGHSFDILVERGIDLVLAGHAHRAAIGLIVAQGGGSLVLVQASTACSTRLRGESNGFGLIALAPGRMVVDIQGWTGEAFHSVRHQIFRKQGAAWRRVAEP